MTYENHKKHIHVMCGQNAEYLKFRHVVELVQNLVAHGDAREGK